jgi:hypothetical protein
MVYDGGPQASSRYSARSKVVSPAVTREKERELRLPLLYSPQPEFDQIRVEFDQIRSLGKKVGVLVYTSLDLRSYTTHRRFVGARYSLKPTIIRCNFTQKNT